MLNNNNNCRFILEWPVKKCAIKLSICGRQSVLIFVYLVCYIVSIFTNYKSWLFIIVFNCSIKFNLITRDISLPNRNLFLLFLLLIYHHYINSLRRSRSGKLYAKKCQFLHVMRLINLKKSKRY